LRVAHKKTFQFARTREQRKRGAVQFDFGPGYLRADGLDAFLHKGAQEIDAHTDRYDEQHDEDENNSGNELFHKVDRMLDLL